MTAVVVSLQEAGLLPYVIGVGVPIVLGSIIATVARRMGWTQ